MRRSLLLLALAGCADAEATYMNSVAGVVQCGDSGGVIGLVATQTQTRYRCVRVIPMVLPDTLPERTK